jgi:hypothetical protein
MTWLRSGACSLSIDDLGRRDELSWDDATPHVRDAAFAWKELMGDRLKREAVAAEHGNEHDDEPLPAREQAVAEPTPTPKTTSVFL